MDTPTGKLSASSPPLILAQKSRFPVQRIQCPILQRPSRDVVYRRCYTCIRRLSTRHVPETDNRSAKEGMACYHADSGADRAARPFKKAVPRIPSPDKNSEINMRKNKDTHRCPASMYLRSPPTISQNSSHGHFDVSHCCPLRSIVCWRALRLLLEFRQSALVVLHRPAYFQSGPA